MTAAWMLLSFLMCVGLRAEEKSGSCNENITWTLSDEGMLTLSGTGNMPDYDSDNTPPWKDDAQNITKAVVSEGITSIGTKAFEQCRKLTEVQMPSTIKTIGTYAFYNCLKLRNITLPASLETIGGYAFWACGIEELTIPSTVTSIGDQAFGNCKFKSLYIPKSVTKIGRSLIYGNYVETIEVEQGNPVYHSYGNAIIETATNTLICGCGGTDMQGSGVTAIADGAFEGCSSLNGITIPETVKTIGDRAFYFCDYLKSVTIHGDLESIGDYAFNRCKKLAAISLSGNTAVPSCGYDVFGNIPANCTLYVPKKLISAYKAADGWSRFADNDNIKQLAYLYAEYNADAKSLKICYGDETDVAEGATVYKLNDKDWGDTDLKDIASSVTSVTFDPSMADYRPTTCRHWFYLFQALESISGMEYVNTADVTDMSGMFSSCNKLQKLDLSTLNTADVTDMSSMFSSCNALQELDLSTLNTAGVTDMSYMFSRCYNLTDLNVKSFNTAGVTDMSYMFAHCNSLKSLDLSSFNTAKVTNMKYMFSDDQVLASIYVGKDFTTARVTNANYMFYKCDALPNFTANDIDQTNANDTYGTGYFYRNVGTMGSKAMLAQKDGSSLRLIDGTVQFDDNSDYTLTEKQASVVADNATYSRTVKSQWGTLCLPYTISQTGDGCTFYTLAGTTDDAIIVKQIDGDIEAGTPVLFHSPEATQRTITFAGSGELVAEPAGAESGDRLAGTFVQTVLDNGNDYFIASDRFRKVSSTWGNGNSGVKTMPFRAWVAAGSEASSANAEWLNIATGDMTGVDGIADTTGTDTAEYYSADGMRTAGLTRGLNIVKMGGKTRKVIVK